MPIQLNPTWVRGYRVHGYWIGGERIGWVGLSPRTGARLVYSWECRAQRGEKRTLRAAKRAVQRSWRCKS